jgi:hypothetical protein
VNKWVKYVVRCKAIAISLSRCGIGNVLDSTKCEILFENAAVYTTTPEITVTAVKPDS